MFLVVELKSNENMLCASEFCQREDGQNAKTVQIRQGLQNLCKFLGFFISA